MAREEEPKDLVKVTLVPVEVITIYVPKSELWKFEKKWGEDFEAL